MRVIRTDTFKQDFRALTATTKRSTEKALRLLLANVRHPSFQAKKMGSHHDPEGRDIWEARLTKAYRMTCVIEGDTSILLWVGPHDTLRLP